MLIKNVYVFQSVLEYIGKVILFVATVVYLTSCSRAQASHVSKQKEVKKNVHVDANHPLCKFFAYGLPKDAYPVAFYGEDSISYNELDDARKREFLNKSCLVNGIQDFGSFYFFIQPIAGSEDECTSFYNLWMYNVATKKISKIFSHHIGEYSEMQIDGVYWSYDIQDNDETYKTSSGTKGVIHHKTATPVVVIAARNIPMTPHPIYLTVILNPLIKKEKVIEEKFISFMSINDNSLPVAEQELSRKVILTTTTTTSSKEIPAPKDADFAVRNILYPSLNAYSTTGNSIGTLSLPHEEIDVIR
jgi:hypothetical protein